MFLRSRRCVRILSRFLLAGCDAAWIANPRHRWPETPIMQLLCLHTLSSFEACLRHKRTSDGMRNMQSSFSDT